MENPTIKMLQEARAQALTVVYRRITKPHRPLRGFCQECGRFERLHEKFTCEEDSIGVCEECLYS